MKLPNFQFIIKLLFRADLLIHIAKNYFCDHCNTAEMVWVRPTTKTRSNMIFDRRCHMAGEKKKTF